MAPGSGESVALVQIQCATCSITVSAEELFAFQANILEKQHSAQGEAEMSLHLQQDFTHNPEDGAIKKVITCVSIEIPA